MHARLRLTRLVLVSALIVLFAAPSMPPGHAADPSTDLPPLPAGWPAALQVGMSDQPNGAATMKATAPYGFRYQYLAGGVNTGTGWATWNADGHFVTYYVQESAEHGIVPVFTYYMIYQSRPGNPASEPDAVLTNLRNRDTMIAYFRDLALFFQRAGAFGPGQPVVLHVEPDLWGYVQQRSTADDAASVPVQVGSTGLSEVAGLPDTAAGLAQAVVRLRDALAPNVRLAYQLSVWGTGVDVALQDPSDAEVERLADRAAAFYQSLGARFDLTFGEFTDRDAGFNEKVSGDRGASWWDAADFRRHVRFLGRYSRASRTRVVLWQIPYGNTKMRAVNNTRHHYQDNRVEWLFDDPAGTHLAEYLNAGVIAFLFGRGADGTTCACDAAGDGVTNPDPINGNTRDSISGDDDGGYFRERTAAYYQAGALPLPAATGATPTTVTSPVASATSATAASASPTQTVPPTTTYSPTPSGTAAQRVLLPFLARTRTGW